MKLAPLHHEICRERGKAIQESGQRALALRPDHKGVVFALDFYLLDIGIKAEVFRDAHSL